MYEFSVGVECVVATLMTHKQQNRRSGLTLDAFGVISKYNNNS